MIVSFYIDAIANNESFKEIISEGRVKFLADRVKEIYSL